MLKRVLLALLSGALYVFSFAPWHQSYLSWFAFLPLFYALDEQLFPKTKKRTAFSLAILVSIVISVGGFYWVVHATQSYGELPLFAALLLFVAFSLVMQLQVPLYALARRLLKPDSHGPLPFFVLPLALGVVYSGIESLYPKLFLDTFGNTFSGSPHWMQLADIGGPFFLTTLLLFSNELLYQGVRPKLLPVKGKVHAPSLALGLLIPVAAYFYGSFRIHQVESYQVESASSPTLRVSLIQANIGDFLKVAAERGGMKASEQVIGAYLDLSKAATELNPPADVMVWPETAYPALFRHPMGVTEQYLENRLLEFSKTIKQTLIFGGYDADSTGTEYNSVFFFNPSEKLETVYHKNILLMFGETLPFADTFPSLKQLFSNMGFFGRGPGPQVFKVKNSRGEEFKLAPSICYEGLFSDFSAQGALLGADALLNVTNDSWFGPYGEPVLHLALTQFRSVETRLPMLRATNTGYTVSIDALGRLNQSTQINEKELLNASLKQGHFPEPPFLKIARTFGGRWYEHFSQIIALCLIALGIYLRKSACKSENS